MEEYEEMENDAPHAFDVRPAGGQEHQAKHQAEHQAMQIAHQLGVKSEKS